MCIYVISGMNGTFIFHKTQDGQTPFEDISQANKEIQYLLWHKSKEQKFTKLRVEQIVLPIRFYKYF